MPWEQTLKKEQLHQTCNMVLTTVMFVSKLIFLCLRNRETEQWKHHYISDIWQVIVKYANEYFTPGAFSHGNILINN